MVKDKGKGKKSEPEEAPLVIEDELARLLGFSKVEFTNEDRQAIARGLADVMLMGNGHLIRKSNGRIKRIDAKHVKIDLDIRK